ncbi:hypothetical protein MO973_45090 [Paenibacillus sp. TRM 82003]|nr:hypothetical protein [Paenibacillus sp. TRM 82003]
MTTRRTRCTGCGRCTCGVWGTWNAAAAVPGAAGPAPWVVCWRGRVPDAVEASVEVEVGADIDDEASVEVRSWVGGAGWACGPFTGREAKGCR